MDGGAKCMVAIINGLHDAGIPVIVVKDDPEKSPAKILAENNTQQAVEKNCSSQTNTDLLKKCHTSSQICDRHFASSYQTAHCGVRSSSPPPLLPEFPPQRAEPNTGHGSFEINGSCTQDYFGSPQTSYWPSREFTSFDRGSLDKGPRGNDAFVQSLRKYPNVPNQSLSSELIDRLLTNTQAKNLTKSSYHTKVTRPVTDRNATVDKETRTNSSKNIQTYTRTKRRCKENGNTTDRDIKFDEESSKTKRLSSKDNFVRSKNSVLNIAYDYLKSSKPKSGATGRGTDMRYLTEVKKCIRNTVRQICQERTSVCPRIRSRYNEHRREHHTSRVGQELNRDSDTCNNEDRASSPAMTEVSIMTQCEAPVRKQTCSSAVNRCCICKKPLPCSCTPGPSKDISTEVFIKCACVDIGSDLKGKIVKEVGDWIKGIPVYASENKRDKEKREKMEKELTEVLEKAIADENVEIVKQEIDKFLDSLPMWRPEEDNERKMFKNQLAEKLIGELRYLAERDVLTDEIADWVKNLTFKDVKTAVFNEVDVVCQLEKNIKSVKKSSNNDDYKEALISVITNVLEDLPIETHGDRNNTMYHLANTLADKLIKIEDKMDSGLLESVDEVVGEELEESIRDEISTIFDNTNINWKTLKKKTFLQNKISKILSRNTKNLLNNNRDKTKREIIELLKKEASIQESEADILTNNLVNKVKGLASRRTDSRLVPRSAQPKDVKASIKEEVTDIFNKFKVKIEDRKTLEETISNLLEDEIVRGVDIDTVRNEYCSLLYDGNIPKEQAENISDELAHRAREISLSYKTKDSILSISARAKSHEDSFKKNVTQIVLDFLQNFDNYDNPNFKEIVKEVTNNFIDNVAKIMLHSDYDKNTLYRETLGYLEKIPITSNIPKVKLADQLIKSLKTINIHISTPRKEKKSFRPQRNSTDSTISSIYFEEDLGPHTKSPVISNEGEKYNNDLTKIIEDWVNSLSFSFNTPDAKEFRKVMINDLVTDFIDRQKYLQLNPVAQVSDKDELEHLKYQVFRWFNKLPNIEDFSDIMLKTNTLMNTIRTVQVPLIIKPVNRRIDNKLREGKIPTYMDALQDEISIWFNEIPDYLCLPMDESRLTTTIADLAEKIQELSNTEADMEDKIMKWLQKTTKNINQNELNEITRNLIARLQTKGFMDQSNWATIQNTSEFIEENLNGALKDWLKDLPLYRTRNSQEKFLQENIVTDLAKDMRRVFDNLQSTSLNIDSDKLFLDEIVKHLKRFPMEIKHKKDENYIKSIAQQLLNFLKGLQIFQDISFRRLTSSEENFEINIEDWIQSLPLEKSKFQELTKQFKAAIQEMMQYDANGQMIITEILKYLAAIPIEASKKNDEMYLNDMAKKLLDILQPVSLKQDVPSRTREFEDLSSSVESSIGPNAGFKKAAEDLYENIENWCEKLPLYSSDTTEDKNRIRVIKQNIASKLIRRIGELNMDLEIFYDDFIYDNLLKDEIEYTLSILPINREIEKDTDSLKLNLFNKIMGFKEKIKNELAGHLYKQGLRDAISKTLPLDERVANENEVFFQNLKENVADAFINLHYFAAKPELQNEFRTKINEQIADFCSNYLKRFPATPIDNSKLNRELYIALKNVPTPTEETIRNQVEEIRTKDEIQDWMRELPLRIQGIPDKQHINKITSIMSKRLHDIKKDKKLISNNKEILKSEIMKWMKKIPLKIEEEHRMDHFAEKLIEKLESTEQSRRVSSSLSKPLDQSTKSEKNACHSWHQPDFSSSLTPEDYVILQRIRKRVTSPKKFLDGCTDATVSPPPIDAESQTELMHSNSCSMQAATKDKARDITSRTFGESKQSECEPCSVYKHDKNTSKLSRDSRNDLAISPRIIVNEYQWDSTQESTSPRQCQHIDDPSSLRHRFSKQQQDSCGIRSPPYLQSCGSHISQYRTGQQKHVEELRSTKRPYQRLNQTDLEQDSLTPRKTFRRPRVPISEPLDAVQDSTLQRSDYEWPAINLPEKNDFLNTQSSRRRVIPSQEDIGRPYTVDQERSNENVRCSCREHILTKCSGRNRGPACQNHESVKQCSKCCGTHCPYPSYLYFRQ